MGQTLSRSTIQLVRKTNVFHAHKICGPEVSKGWQKSEDAQVMEGKYMAGARGEELVMGT
jgi:hypothetical protein